MKYLIAGRTGTGKDTIKEFLEHSYNWKFVKSYTTRPRRSPDEDTHIFLTEEEAAKIEDKDKAAKTVINGYQYFATKQQIEEADAYIIDPVGIKNLAQNMPHQLFEIVYIKAKDEAVHEEMAIKRAADLEKELEIYKKRCESENEQFTAFEKKIADKEFPDGNLLAVLTFDNDYTEASMQNLAIELEMRRRFSDSLTVVCQRLIDDKLLPLNDTEDKVSLQVGDKIEDFTAEEVANIITGEKPDDTLFSLTMRRWIWDVGYRIIQDAAKETKAED